MARITPGDPTPSDVEGALTRWREAAAMGDEWYVTSAGHTFLEDILRDVGVLARAFAGVAREVSNQGLFDDPDTWVNEILRVAADGVDAKEAGHG